VFRSDKKNIIILTDNINRNTFLLNELSVLIKYFNIYVISKVKPTKDYDFQVKYINRLIFLPIFIFSPFFINDILNEFIQIFRTKKKKKLSIMLKQAIPQALSASIYRYIIKKIIIKKRLNKNNTILYSYWFNDLALAISTFKKYGYRIITRVHGYDLHRHRYKSNYLPFQEIIQKEFDRIYFNSNNSKKYYEKTFKVINKNCSIQYIGTFNDYDKSLKLLDLYTKQKQLNIVSCSNVINVKRIDLIINTLSYIDEFLIHWVHIGDGPLLNDCIKYAEDKLKINFDFLGYLSNTDIFEYYRNNQIDLFLHLSDSEGLGVALIEAMSFCIPVIARDVGGISEIVINDYNGILLEEHIKPEKIANEIVDFWNKDENSIKNMKINALKTWNKKFNAENTFSDLSTDIKKVFV
jgi:glycosyltransferase involved in cell wall biosynthesis